MASHQPNVAIIGAGLSGLTMALALHQQGIPSTIYESRPAPLNIGGAVMLSPNALKVLDALELYDQVKNQGYSFTTLDFKDVAGNRLETYEFGSKEKYGYNGLRIYRYVLIDALLAAVKAKNVPIRYGMKYSHIVDETSDTVTVAFTDGTTETASLLIGADGIHSTVRKYLYPDLTTKFMGMAGVTAAVPTAQLRLPADYHIPVTIMSPQGAFVIAPQQVDGSEVLIGKQQRIPEQPEPGFERTPAAKEAAIKFLSEGNDHFPEIVRNAVSHIPIDKLNIWPFFVVPKLDRWASEKRRVVILGDAAHAIPPSAGQGINQAFEDVYMLALLLGQAAKIRHPEASMSFWQTYRQNRVDRILELNKQIDLRRMPADPKEAKREPLPFELEWLYMPNFKQDVEDWVAQQEQAH